MANMTVPTPSDCASPSHTVALVRSLPGVINFAWNQEIIIPLQRMLAPEYDWVLKLTHFCSSPVRIHNDHHYWLNGIERFRLHCHCLDPHSLQCQAATVVMVQLVRKFFRGCGYNNKFLMYRELCNYKVSNGIGLVGSSLVEGLHYIYIKVSLQSMYNSIRRHIYLGNHVSCAGSLGYYLVLVCTKCGRMPSTVHAERCAKRTRRLLLRCYRLLRKTSKFTLYSCEASERHIRRRLRHYVWYKLPLCTETDDVFL